MYIQRDTGGPTKIYYIYNYNYKIKIGWWLFKIFKLRVAFKSEVEGVVGMLQAEKAKCKFFIVPHFSICM